LIKIVNERSEKLDQASENCERVPPGLPPVPGGGMGGRGGLESPRGVVSARLQPPLPSWRIPHAVKIIYTEMTTSGNGEKLT